MLTAWESPQCPYSLSAPSVFRPYISGWLGVRLFRSGVAVWSSPPSFRVPVPTIPVFPGVSCSSDPRLSGCRLNLAPLSRGYWAGAWERARTHDAEPCMRLGCIPNDPHAVAFNHPRVRAGLSRLSRLIYRRPWGIFSPRSTPVRLGCLRPVYSGVSHHVEAVCCLSGIHKFGKKRFQLPKLSEGEAAGLVHPA